MRVLACSRTRVQLLVFLLAALLFHESTSQTATIDPDEPQLLNFGETLELNCSFPNSATFSWTLDEDDDFSASGSTLTIAYEDIMDADNGGNYVCVARNTSGANFSSLPVFVALAPYFTASPQSVKTMVSSSIELMCNVTGFPLPDITWVKLPSNSINESVTPLSDTAMEFIVDETMIERYTDVDTMVNVSVLTLNPVGHDDFGYYACIATQSNDSLMMDMGSYNISDIATVTVSPTNSITIEPNFTTVSNYEYATFNCSAEGGPNNVFVWIRTEDIGSLNLVSQSGFSAENTMTALADVSISNDSVLSVMVNDPAQNGGGYTCFVYNEAGIDGSNATLHVHPFITQPPQAQYVTNNATVTLTCVGASFPSPTYQWQRINVTDNMTETLGETGSALMLGAVGYDDFAAYQCIVTASETGNTNTSTPALITVSPEGSIEVSPPSQTVSINDDTSFSCTARGGPNNTIVWIRGTLEENFLSEVPLDVRDILNRLPIRSSERMLSLESVNGSDGGQYTCVALNEAGIDNATVDVLVRPQILTNPVNGYVDAGDNFTFSCLADSYPPPDYRWEKYNESNNDFYSVPDANGRYFVIEDLEYEDSGRYRCVATASMITEIATSNEAILTVSPNGSVTIDPSLRIAANGSDVTFTCFTRGGPNNTFIWTRSDTINSGINETEFISILSTRPIDVEAFLRLANPVILENGNDYSLMTVNATEDGGKYQCTVINQAGIGRNDSVLYVSPAITLHPVDRLVSRGQSFNLTCLADAFPSPSYQWERMNQTTSNFEELVGKTYPFLSFNNVDYDDFGMYRCVASSNGISDTATSRPALVTVSPVGSTQATPSSQNVSRNETAVFTCTAQGGPNTTLVWIRGDRTNLPILTTGINVTSFLNSLDTIVYRVTLSLELSVNNVNGTNGGQYTCVAVNEAGAENVTVRLLVRPQILTGPEDQFTNASDDITLECEADSYPAPNYQWEMMNRATGQYELIANETSDTLTLDSIMFDAYGRYRCVATADGIEGNDTSTPALVTVSPFSSVVAEPVNETLSIGSTTSFTCRAQGGPYNMFRWIKGSNITSAIQSVGAPPLDVSQFLSDLDNITSDYSLSLPVTGGAKNGGEYTCVVVNEAGYDTDNVTLYVSPVITTNPAPQYAHPRDTVTISCVADSYPPPNYQWQMMNRTTGDFENIDGATMSNYTIDDIDYDDYGMYRCAVTTPIINEVIYSEPALITVSPLNSAMATPIKQTLSVGETANFTCAAQGGPNNTFNWIKGSSISSLLSFTSQPLNVSDFIDSLGAVESDDYSLAVSITGGAAGGGEYTCVVVNEAGYDTDNVTLYISPVITTNPAPQYAHPGDTVTISCEADSYPPPNYQWQRMNEVTGFGNIVGATMSSYTISDIDYDDFGMYRCAVTTPIINETIYSQPALITVSANSSVNIDPDFIIVNNGSSVTFSCSAMGGPSNTFIWIRPSDINSTIESLLMSTRPIQVANIVNGLSNIALSNEPSLTITYVNATRDGGDYLCYVINGAGVEMNRTTLFVRPAITENPENVYTNVDETVSLSCRADSYPTPNYQWEMMNRAIGWYELIANETSYTLTLDSIMFDEYGRYRCVATANGIEGNATSTSALVTVSPFSSVVAEPETQTLFIGNTTNFTCRAQGGPYNMFRWIKGSNITSAIQSVGTPALDVSQFLSYLNNITSDYSLSLPVTGGAADGGEYTCVVVNEAGYDTDNVTLYVSPNITTNPAPQYAHPRDTVTISCVADSYPPPNYQWQMMNRTTTNFENIDGATMSNYTIDDIDYDDYGMYRCAVTTPIIDEVIYSQPALITVSPRNSVILDPDFIIADNGSDITFTCSASGGPNNAFRWVRADAFDSLIRQSQLLQSIQNLSQIPVGDLQEELSNISLAEGQSFTLYSINATEDGGQYFCIVINEAGVELNSTLLYVRPVITIQPQDVFTDANVSISLNCLADSFPAPYYRWRKLSMTGMPDGYVAGGNESTLIFSSIDYEDYGVYYCVAAADGIQEVATSDNVTITVSPLGSVSISPSVNNSFEGQRVVLTCNGRGGPFNGFQWNYTRNSTIVSNDSVYELTSGVETAGDYQCTVSNRAGSGSSTATVNVGPVIVVDPLSVNVSIEVDNITLNCTARGFPVPNITWIHNGTLLTSMDADEVSIVTMDTGVLRTVRSTLVIYSALANNTGDYACIARSPFYSDVTSTTARVLVQDIPAIPFNLNTTGVTSRSLTLSWVEPHPNNAPILGYDVFYTTPDFLGGNEVEITVNGSVERVFIERLHPGVTYSFTVLAFNEEGDSGRSESLSQRTLEEVPSGFPQNFSSTTLSSTSINVTWSPVLLAERNGIITGYTIFVTTNVTFVSNTTENITSASTLYFEFTDLQEYVHYTFSILARTAEGDGPTSETVTSLTDEAIPSGFPQDLFSTTLSPTSINVTWSPVLPADRNGIITGYTIFVTTNVTFVNDTSEDITSASTLYFTFTDLEEYVNYTFSILAMTAEGDGPTSETVTSLTDEATPSGFPQDLSSTTLSTTSINVTWSPVLLADRNGIITGYTIFVTTNVTFVSNTTENITSASTLYFEFTDLQEYVHYTFSILARTAEGDGPTSETVTSLTDEAIPSGFPQDLFSTTLSPTSINVTWSPVLPADRNGIITGYTIFVTTNVTFVNDTSEDITSASTLYFTFTDLEEYVNYTFSILAMTAEGDGPTSETVTSLTDEATPSGFPQDLSSTTLSTTSINVTWSPVLLADRNGIITGYTIFVTTNVTFVSNTTENITSASTLYFEFTDLQEYVHYTFSILARTAEGDGPTSETVTSLTDEATPASPPLDFNVTDTTPNTMSLSWSPPLIQDVNGVIDNYTIRYYITEQLGVDEVDDTVNTMVVSSTTATLTGLGNYTVYNISVSAVTVGEGPSTSLSQRTAQNVPGAPPQMVSAVTESTTSINVSWSPPPLNMTYGIITVYEVQYGEYNATTGELMNGTDPIRQNITDDSSTFMLTFENLQEAREYGFQVRAITVGGGPYSQLATNTTEEAPPAAAPENITAPPLNEIEPDQTPSVTLSWKPIATDDANGDLMYFVGIDVEGKFNATSSSRKKRETLTISTTNTLDLCLEAANISRTINVTVPGTQTSLTLNVAPYTEYSFTVTGFTPAGSGPTSTRITFFTPQGPSTAPQSVRITNTSSTSLMVEWYPPLCYNGILDGYMVYYRPLMSDLEPQGVEGTPSSPIPITVTATTSAPSTALNQGIMGLTPNTEYEVMVCATNGAGCGSNETGSVRTTEDAPLAVTGLTLTNVQRSVSNITVSWTPPSERNGTFLYELNYTATQDFNYNTDPPRRQTNSSTRENILGGSNNNEVLLEVLPFATYTIEIFAFNRLFGKSLSGPPRKMTIQTLPTNSSEVHNMTASSQSNSAILVRWDIPLYPNGNITYYEVYSNNSDTPFGNTTSTFHILTGLTTDTTYNIRVRPVTIFDSVRLSKRFILTGNFSQSIAVTLSSTTAYNGTFYTTETAERSISSFDVDLPSPSAFGANPLLFYGVIVANLKERQATTQALQVQYPNPQPYSDDSTYYITAGWNSNVPSSLKIGDRSTTTATRPNQGQQTYENRKLSRRTEYAVIVIVYLDSGVEGEPLIRYARISQVETKLGYNEPALAFFMTLLIILIIAGIVVVIVFLLYKYRHRLPSFRSGIYSLVQKKDGRADTELEAINGSGGGMVIVNKPADDNDVTGGKWISTSEKGIVHIDDFPAHVANMHANDDYLFSVEYPTVEPQHHPTKDATQHPDNAIKNRYANISAYDHSRVRLVEDPNVPGSDYINANYIDGYQEENAYIASQGPVPHSIVDFWRMIWEQKTETIVMLTNLEEKGRIKCHLYWPAPDKRVVVHGHIRIQLQEELSLTDYTIRTFSLQHKVSADERTVKQFHFTSWPDFGVPEHPTTLLRFIHKVSRENPKTAGPIIVHCSAGVGRTGTFVTISCQIKQILDRKCLDIFNFVQSMRYRRCFMVQTEAQYIFIHDALLEYLECGETEVSAREVKEQFRQLNEIADKEDGKTRLEKEFDNIQATIHREPIVFSGTSSPNRHKNRYANVIPFDKTRCKLSTIPGVEGSDYINANFIEGYHKGKAFIATQGPLPDTTDDFWRMVWEHKCSTIIMLANEREGGKAMCHKYWPDSGTQMYGFFEVTLHSMKEYPDYILREFKIVDSRDADGSSQHIKQFQYVSWPSKGVPDSAIGLLDVREQVEKWQRNSGDKPIVVHCSGGCGRTGTYIATCLLIDRLKTEGLVDVFQVVRQLRLQRPGMVRSVDQYEFCYKSVLEYLGSFDTYANFSL